MIGVQSKDVPALWPHIRHLVNQALKHGNGEYIEADIFDALINARMQLWWGDETILVTELVKHPQKTICNAFLAAGKMDEIAKALPRIELWAKAQGADMAVVRGRKGWKRALAAKGYSETHTVLRKQL